MSVTKCLCTSSLGRAFQINQCCLTSHWRIYRRTVNVPLPPNSPPPNIFFIFMQFWPNDRLVPPLPFGILPGSGKSWIRHFKLHQIKPGFMTSNSLGFIHTVGANTDVKFSLSDVALAVSLSHWLSLSATEVVSCIGGADTNLAPLCSGATHAGILWWRWHPCRHPLVVVTPMKTPIGGGDTHAGTRWWWWHPCRHPLVVVTLMQVPFGGSDTHVGTRWWWRHSCRYPLVVVTPMQAPVVEGHDHGRTRMANEMLIRRKSNSRVWSIQINTQSIQIDI